MMKSDIGYCVELTSADLEFMWQLTNREDIEQIEIATNADGLRIKANWGVWSPPFGKVTGTP